MRCKDSVGLRIPDGKTLALKGSKMVEAGIKEGVRMFRFVWPRYKCIGRDGPFFVSKIWPKIQESPNRYPAV